MGENNPIKTAQEEVAALVHNFETRLKAAQDEIKLCTVELEKWRDIAAKLAEVTRISNQPPGQRHELKTQVKKSSSHNKVGKGFWREFWTQHLTKPMKVKDAINLALQLVSNCDTNMAQCAIQRYVADGTIFQDGDSVVLKSYLEVQ